jgi:hypothetical protein
VEDIREETDNQEHRTRNGNNDRGLSLEGERSVM